MRFCPTGGISLENAATYLALPNVLCVGGSWVAPDMLIQAGDWEGIERLARAAVERLTRT
jgi:2-dehydro-3-deoxyphosphogluconate aldolase/(4S)-4-hydroxy-2-oxoglutarate aldolase